jgi:ubiquitin-protein ligase
VDGDVQAFETILYHANVNQTPKITFKDLDSWIDNPETDIEKEMKDVQDFLLSSNACKKQTETMIKEIAEAEAKQKN